MSIATMARSISVALIAVTLTTPCLAQEVTGLAGWTIYLDPGHSGIENMGVFGYSEAEKNLHVGLALRDLLLLRTDVDAVYMSRTNSQMQVSLTQRVDHANQVGADHFHSIHSNAAAPSANHVFVLWPQYRDGSEAVPNGGRRMAEIMSSLLGRSMRIESQGGIGECDFYGVSSCRSRDAGGKGGSRNYVQSFTAMPSQLSEAGFHTNPTQNQRNMNADWKRLEALAQFWSILDFHGIERTRERIVTGIISDVENDRPINGAVVALGDTAYVTDTHASLFSRFSTDPELLRNGFYFLDGIGAGVLPLTVSAEGYEEFEATVSTTDTFYTFVDVKLISIVPPVVASSTPDSGDERFRITDPLIIDFSRRMDRIAVENAFSISPDTDGQFFWSPDDTRLTFRPDTLYPETDYVVRIGEEARGIYGHGLDGDFDGEAGGAFELSFRTGAPDAFAPVLVDGFPRPQQADVPVRPIITYAFDEPLLPASITPDLFSLVPSAEGSAIPGSLTHNVVNGQSVIAYFPDRDLEPGIFYLFSIDPGLSDLAGNVVETQRRIPFRTTSTPLEVITIDPFEPSDVGVWWQPQQSGSTAGIVTDSTAFLPDTTLVNLLTASTQARRLDYGWQTQVEDPLIRAYLSDGPARDVWFGTDHALQVYLFGDGSGNRFRFAVDDQSGHEVSPWITIDWLGWRLVSWDLSLGEVGTWIGDGVLNAPLRMDSFQLTSGDDSRRFGSLWLDDLHLARPATPTSSDDPADAPAAFGLDQNYPNPFAAQTTFRFVLRSAGTVSLTIYNAIGERVVQLVENQPFSAGRHEVRWNADNLPSGVYFARMKAAAGTASIRVVLVR